MDNEVAALKVIEQHGDNVREAVEAILTGPEVVCKEMIKVGLKHIARLRRRQMRRES